MLCPLGPEKTQKEAPDYHVEWAWEEDLPLGLCCLGQVIFGGLLGIAFGWMYQILSRSDIFATAQRNQST